MSEGEREGGKDSPTPYRDLGLLRNLARLRDFPEGERVRVAPRLPSPRNLKQDLCMTLTGNT
mgnify:CR=1 FL=1